VVLQEDKEQRRLRESVIHFSVFSRVRLPTDNHRTRSTFRDEASTLHRRAGAADSLQCG